MTRNAGFTGLGKCCHNFWALLACAAFTVLADQAAAQEEGATEPAQSEEIVEDVPEDTFLAPVEIDGEALFLIRGSTALPADERADKVEERIIAIAEDENIKVLQIEVKDDEFGKSVLINGRMVTIATEADAEFEQMEVELLADLQAEAIEAAIIAYRDQRSTSGRVDSALAAFGWSVGFFVFCFFFFKFRDRIAQATANLVEARFQQVEEATKSVVRSQAVGGLVRYLVQLIQWIIFLVLLYYYLSFVLLSFAETRRFAQVLLTYVSEPLINIFLGFVSYLPNIITLTIIAIVTRYAIKGLRLFFENIEAGTFQLREFEPHWIAPTFQISRIVVILIALVFAYPFIPGSDSAAFQGLTILAGIMVSLGSNTVVSNMMAGLFVIYRRSTNVGDRIKVGDQIGDVVDIKLMETLIKSIKNEMISIPNSQLLNSEVINYSRKIDGRGLLVHTTVGIGYEEPPEKVKAMLIEAAHRTQGLKKSPEPFVLWTALADYAINYQINAFTNRGGSLPKILSDLHENIVTVFNENGTQIMTPSYVADPSEPKIPGGNWDGRLATPSTGEAM